MLLMKHERLVIRPQRPGHGHGQAGVGTGSQASALAVGPSIRT